MSEESEDKQKQAKKLSVLSKLFGTPSDLLDLINPKRSQRRRRYVAPMRIARPRIKENEEFKARLALYSEPEQKKASTKTRKRCDGKGLLTNAALAYVGRGQ